MSYILVEDFKSGLDRRKSILTGAAGSLYRLTNAVITRGGEIEKRRAFVSAATLPSGTVGLAATANQGLFVFGDTASPPAGLPSWINYKALDGEGSALVKIDSWDVFAGKLYVAATFSDGAQRHYYDGVIIKSGVHPSYPRATCVLTFKNKMYMLVGSVLYFSAVGSATDWVGVGSGLIDMSTQIGGAETLVSMAPYQTDLAIFARSVTQIWQVDDDPSQNLQKQVLNNIGTFAPLGVTNFGDSDVFFLAESGVRSVRARDSSNSAAVSDVGVPIDSYIGDILGNLTLTQQAAAIGLIDLIDGRYWLILYDRIFVFSFYPSSKISAWSEFLPGFIIEYAVLSDNRVWLRSGDTIYIYGGETNLEYDTSLLEVIVPYLDATKPATSKTWHGVDIAATGEWHIEAGTDPEQPGVRDEIGILINSSFGLGKVAFDGEGTHVGVRMYNNRAERATLASMMIHFAAYKED